MQGRTRVVYRLAAAAWLGAVVFLAFALSPLAFGLVAPAERGQLLRWAIGGAFPAAMVAGAVTAAALAWRAGQGERQHLVVRGILVAGALVLCGFAYWLGLRMETLQAAGAEAYGRTHSDAVGLLAAVLLILLAIVGLG